MTDTSFDAPEPDWEPPRCSHGHIILGCPSDTCPAQTAYLSDYSARYTTYIEEQQRQARLLIRSLMGANDDG